MYHKSSIILNFMKCYESLPKIIRIHEYWTTISRWLKKVKNMAELLRTIMQYVNSHLSTTAFVLAGKVKNYISETNFPDY